MEKMSVDGFAYLNMNQNTLTEKQVKHVFKCTVEAVKFCHDKNIMHKDLKPENILLNIDRDREVIDIKLCDFGMAEWIAEKDGFCYNS